MPEYLYVLGIGPVQGFIASARRTRDLWMGSHLISEISKAAAREINCKNGKLIFPALIDENQILHTDRLDASYKPDAFNVANIVRAILTVSDPKELTKLNNAIQAAACNEWKTCYADKARKAFDKIPRAIEGDIWDAQVKDVIEFYAAWVPLNGDYDAAQKRLMRLFGSRKALRNFDPSPATDEIKWRVEKSSLDGSRESVLNPEMKIPRELALRMRLGPNERLCAVGVTKRIGGEEKAQPFPSVVRIALDPWIRGVTNSDNLKANTLLHQIAAQCDSNNSFSSGTGERNRKKFYPDFPFDGQVLFKSRLEELKTDPMTDENDLEKINVIGDLAEQLRSCKSVRGTFGEPNPYYAILVADGDRMGKVISHIKTYERHQLFSAQLAKFAGEARAIVENDTHHGVMVFAGGEDILAFLPVDTCIAAARALHAEFGTLMKDFKDEEENPATLSVGIAIGHSKDPLEDILQYGHDAEKDAKDPDRNGLAIHYHARNGGDPIKVREQWIPKDYMNREGKTMKGTSIDLRIDNWVSLFRTGKIPDGGAYELRQLAEDYRGWKTIPDDLLDKDIRRLLNRKRTDGDKKISGEEIEKLVAGVTSYDLFVRRADELILARKIAESAMQADTQQNPPEVKA